MRVAGVLSHLLFAIGVATLGVGSIAPLDKKVSFSHDILPILSDKCFKCHGPDGGARQANLRLDTAEGAYADRGGRWAIVPGKPESSLLVQKIHSTTSPMPPPYSGKSLTEDEKALLTRWIKEGAPYGKLWSFEPIPKAVPIPKAGGGWAKSDLDRFVFERLLTAGLKPSPPASKERWLRRVTLDLTGLPPTEEEIHKFLADKEAHAFEKVTDRLLASPHFGERMAVDWLDAARYADSYGYQSDLLMPTWPYRDWVVKAFNSNLPYSEFLVDQIAGDLLPNATRDQILATAFNRLHRQSNEGGSIPEEFKTEYAVDRVSTYGTAFLGLTFGCARCHDHKFDPITQREFYQLYAYFNSIDEFGLLLSTEIVPTPSLLLPTPEQETRLAELREVYVRATAYLEQIEGQNHPAPSGGKSLGTFFDLDNEKFTSQDGKVAAAKLGKPETVEGYQGKALRFDGDNGLAIRGLSPRDRWDAFTWAFWVSDPRQKGPVVLLHRTGGTDVGFCGFDLMLEDGYLTARVMRHWPGNAIAVRTKERIPKDAWAHVGWSWDGSGRPSGLKIFVGGKPSETVVLASRLWKRIAAYGDLGSGGGDWTFATRFRDAGFKGGAVDEIAFADRVLAPSQIDDLRRLGSKAALSQPEPEFEAARAAAQKAHRDLAEFEDGIQEISVMGEASPEIPAYLLARGAYDAPKSEANRVTRGVPKSLPALTSKSNNRLDLAEWTVSEENPLTARVAVNRLWQMLFGTGLVETSENFGMQGAQPSNPELLDYLARHLMDLKWNVKALLKEIVLSATYSQDSIFTRAGFAKDPHNRLLWRGPNGRLSAEMTRDSMLAAAGLLTDKLGGPPVNPYQPAGIWQEFNTMSPGFMQSKGANLYRRSLYSTVKRTTPIPNMILFDAGAREACIVRRPITDTPLQALALMNDVQFVEAARALAELVMKRETTDEKRIRLAFLRLASREPDTQELTVLQRTLDDQRVQFRKDVLSAAKLIAVGDSNADPSLRPSELAAMTVCVQTILNSDAAIWKR